MYEALNAIYVLTDLGCWGQTTEGRAVSTLMFLTGEVNKSQEVTILCPWMVIRIWTEMFSFKVLITTTHICICVYVVCICVHVYVCTRGDQRLTSSSVFPSCSSYFLRQSLSLSPGRINLGMLAGSWNQKLCLSLLSGFSGHRHMTPCQLSYEVWGSGFRPRAFPVSTLLTEPPQFPKPSLLTL